MKPEDAPFRARIKNAIDRAGGPQEAARKTGIPLGTIKKYAAQSSTASFTNGALIAMAANLPLEALAFSREENIIRGRHMVDAQRPTFDPIPANDSDLIRVPRYNVVAAAGDGIVPIDELDEMGDVVFARSFIRRLGGTPEECHIIFARGESMLPTIPEGSLLLIDRSKRRIEDNGVFVFRVGEMLKVKRARWRIDQRLDLVSDNQVAGYPPETYTLRELDDIAPVGRVICIMRGP